MASMKPACVSSKPLMILDVPNQVSTGRGTAVLVKAGGPKPLKRVVKSPGEVAPEEAGTRFLKMINQARFSMWTHK